MKKVILAIAIIASSSLCASDFDLLREGCAALKPASKKAQCLASANKLDPTNAVTADFEMAKQKILAMLNDPESARFKSVAKSPSSGAICGLVNAKNPMGGYPGFQRFIVTSDSARVDGAETWKMDVRWSELCSDAL
ncbi:hypothetical protein HSX11_01575 [Oxalobacteraceae bacterium]|nr:hypothetical protein [Oxalobacteraceae bacterium]